MTDLVYAAIKDYLDANWSTIPLVYENTNDILDDLPAAFAFVEVSGSIRGQASVGAATQAANLWRESGLLWFNVMVTSGSGSVLARQYARQLADLFKGLTLMSGALTFGDVTSGLGEHNGNYWRLSVTVEWKLDS